MKTISSMLFVSLLLGSTVLGSAVTTNPIAKVLEMISGLQQDLIKEGEDDQKVYNEFASMCSRSSRELHQEIKTSKEQVASLTASMEKGTAVIAVLNEKISDLAAEVSDAEGDLKKATAMRKKESSDFSVEDKELQKTISTIERSISIIEREGASASLAQIDHMQSVTSVLQAMVDASMVDSYDAAKLTALMQKSNEKSESFQEEDEKEDMKDEEDSTGAPSAAAYESKSGTIVNTLEGMLDKAQKELEEARDAETKAMNGYEMLKQSLDAKIKTLNKGLGESKQSLAANSEAKATAKGNRQMTEKDMKENEKELAELHRECLDKATTFQDATSERGEELKALAEAKKIIVASTGGAADQSYGLVQASFLQVDSGDTSSDTWSTAADAVNVVRRLAGTLHSESFLALSNHMSQVISRSSRAGEDPFHKVKTMIESMIGKLEDEASSDATKKAYCDKEMAETKGSKDDKESEIEKLSTQIDVMTASSKKLKGEVSRLNKELGALAKTQAETDKLRFEEKALYNKNLPVMKQGLEGVKKALTVLREYYAKDDKDGSGGGAASGIVGMLEVVESDFSKGIAEMVATEESAQSMYEKVKKENELVKVAKEQDSKYKAAEAVALDKSVAELKSDRTGVVEELDAVVSYFASVKKECVAKPDSYEEKKKAREAQMEGLKEALETLEGDAAFLQRGRRGLRGAARLEPEASE